MHFAAEHFPSSCVVLGVLEVEDFLVSMFLQQGEVDAFYNE